jgi:hypothetical protein
MSANGDAIGLGILTGQTAATNQFIAMKRGQPLTPADNAQLQMLRAKAEGNAIDAGIQAVLVSRPRVFIGTDPNPNPTSFKEGDIYFLREE